MVVGIPRPEGSTSYKGMRGGKPIIVHDDPHLNDWRKEVGKAARYTMGPKRPFTGAIAISCRFVVPRPQVLPAGRTAPSVKPDLDKLVRGVCDAMSTIVYKDDAQVTEYWPPFHERYPLDAREPAGAIIRVWALDPQQEGLDL